MSVVEPGPRASNLVQRVKDILLQPGATWDAIDAEEATIGGLYRSYVIPLALIPVVCGLIGAVAFGFGGFGFTFRPAIQWVLSAKIASFLISLASVYVLALIIDALAPSFGGQRNRIQAFKVAAYSWTAAWVAGVFQILPALSILGILGLYSLYLLYKGLPKLMKAPEDKALGYTVVIIIMAVVLSLVAGAVVAPIMRIGHNPYSMMHAGRGTMTMPGGTSIDMGKLEAASKQIEAASKRMGTDGEGAVEATDPSILKGYLPATVAGYGRTEISASSGGVGGLTGSSAVGTYNRGDGRFTLTVTDLGAAGALTAMAGVLNVQSSKESEGRYEKVGKVGGRMTMEEFDRDSGHGAFGVLVADRFMVQAEGERVAIEDLKAAVNSVGFSQLEQLAEQG